MDLVERPVAHAGRSESAAVADAVLQDAPRVAELAAVLLDCVDDLAVIVGPLLADAEGLLARPQGRIPPALHDPAKLHAVEGRGGVGGFVGRYTSTVALYVALLRGINV